MTRGTLPLLKEAGREIPLAKPEGEQHHPSGTGRVIEMDNGL